MKTFGEAITLSLNSRGCLIMDTVKGCSVAAGSPRGCYDDCYAAKIAARYGINFGAVTKRRFIDNEHFVDVVKQINRSSMPFVRIGEMGDPSCNWEHTLSVIDKVKPWIEKEIVVITKHLSPVPAPLLPSLSGVFVNTSVSAMDAPVDLRDRLVQHKRLAKHCNSVLRVVSCDFNKGTARGLRLSMLQDELLCDHATVETVFRPSLSNPLLVDGTIIAKKSRFLRSAGMASVRSRAVFFGRCDTCPDMCGLELCGYIKRKQPKQMSIQWTAKESIL